MEANLTKQTVSINQNIYEGVLEQAIDVDFTLPDYCPDILRVLKCRIVPNINSKNISGGELNIDGIAFLTLIYVDEREKIFSYEQSYDFKKSIALEGLTDENFASINLYTDYVNCRAITSRKIDLHGVISIKVSVNALEKYEIITDIDCEGIQLKRGECPATNPLATSEKTVLIEEELELSRGNSAINSIIRCDAKAVSEGCSLVGNKALIKGEIIINVLYCSDSGSTELYENRIPFSQILELETNGIECRCSSVVDLISYHIKPRTNLSGETNCFSFECKLSVLAQASCENNIPLLLDAFSTKNECTQKIEKINFKKLDYPIMERYLCKKVLDLPDNSFGNVLDMWCETRPSNVKIQNKELSLIGSVMICILLVDAEGKPQYFERSIDYEFKKNIDSDNGNLTAEVEVDVMSSVYTIKDASRIEACVELCVCGSIFSHSLKEIIRSIEVSDITKEHIRKAPMIIYFCEEGESIWDISKKYNASPQCILKANELEEDCVLTKRALLIP